MPARSRAWKVLGSMRAITWPLRTLSLKSTSMLCSMPETCVPISTVAVALRVPVAEIAVRISPRSTGAVR